MNKLNYINRHVYHNKPVLPPKAGYVEIADENGNHVYKATAETLEQQSKDKRIAELEKENKTLKAKTKASEETTALLEECLVEMAEIVYA